MLKCQWRDVWAYDHGAFCCFSFDMYSIESDSDERWLHGEITEETLVVWTVCLYHMYTVINSNFDWACEVRDLSWVKWSDSEEVCASDSEAQSNGEAIISLNLILKI